MVIHPKSFTWTRWTWQCCTGPAGSLSAMSGPLYDPRPAAPLSHDWVGTASLTGRKTTRPSRPSRCDHIVRAVGMYQEPSGGSGHLALLTSAVAHPRRTGLPQRPDPAGRHPARRPPAFWDEPGLRNRDWRQVNIGLRWRDHLGPLPADTGKSRCGRGSHRHRGPASSGPADFIPYLPAGQEVRPAAMA